MSAVLSSTNRSSSDMEMPFIRLPFLPQVHRLRSDCIRLGYLLEAKLTVPNSSTAGSTPAAATSRNAKEPKRCPLPPSAAVENNKRRDSPPGLFREKLSPPLPQMCRRRPVRQHQTVPRPFRLTSRSPVACRFAQRHLEAMLEERKRRETVDARKEPFRARPVPESTYRSDSHFRVGLLKRGRAVSLPAKSEKSVPIRHRPVPLSTYIRPNSSSGEMRMFRRERNAMEQLAKSRGPRGMEEHSTRWRVRWSLRHSTRCFRPASYPQPRAESVPDFALLHAKFQRQLAASRQIRHTTTPQPFRLSIKTKSQKSAPVR
uniref:Uncharacterized protein n=1 Tax=Globodera rostochiensis TaxID=31243 RepID=A0A914HHW0_GLORO